MSKRKRDEDEGEQVDWNKLVLDTGTSIKALLKAIKTTRKHTGNDDDDISSEILKAFDRYQKARSKIKNKLSAEDTAVSIIFHVLKNNQKNNIHNLFANNLQSILDLKDFVRALEIRFPAESLPSRSTQRPKRSAILNIIHDFIGVVGGDDVSSTLFAMLTISSPAFKDIRQNLTRQLEVEGSLKESIRYQNIATFT